LSHFPSARKIVALGDMLELGSASIDAHRQAAEQVLHAGADIFIAVGPQMKIAAEELKSLNFDKDRIFIFDKSDQAAKKLKDLLQDGDAILVKGSQGMRMEKIIPGVMANPKQAAQLLCRQEPYWLKA